MARRPNSAVRTLNLRARRVSANGGYWQQPFGMDNVNWRTQLQPDSRQRIVNKIVGTLKKHLPFSGGDELDKLKEIAERFEENIFTEAPSQPHYLRTIARRMMTMETRRLTSESS